MKLLSATVAGQDDLYSAADREANMGLSRIGLSGGIRGSVTIPERTVIALDGDGSLLLNLGILPVLADQTETFVIVFDNGVYEAGEMCLHGQQGNQARGTRGEPESAVAVQTGVKILLATSRQPESWRFALLRRQGKARASRRCCENNLWNGKQICLCVTSRKLGKTFSSRRPNVYRRKGE
jgi:hypothetical protein